MATNFVDNTTYAGKDTLGFYSTALLTGDTKSKVRLVPNVKSKIKLASLNLSNILQASDCSWSDSGTATLAQKTLEVCPIKINLEFCEHDFEVDYLSEQLKAGSNKGQIPASFQDYILGEVAKNVSADLENLFWQGDTSASPADLCDGLIVQLEDDSTVLDLTAVSGGVTASNVIAELGRVYEEIPCTISETGKVVIFIGCDIAKFYREALAALGTNFATYNAGNFDLNYMGVPLIVSQGLPANTMVAADPQNLWYGTDLVSDPEDIMIISMKSTTGVPTVRFVAEFKFGVNFGVGAEIVLYN